MRIGASQSDAVSCLIGELFAIPNEQRRHRIQVLQNRLGCMLAFELNQCLQSPRSSGDPYRSAFAVSYFEKP